MLPPNYSEPPNICTTCGKTWEGNPYDFETDDHKFPCPNCATKKCKNCQEGHVFIEHTIEVSRDMALDAGDLSLEGELWDWGSESVVCECCQGHWEDCPTCNVESQSDSASKSDKITGHPIADAVQDLIHYIESDE